MIEKPPYEELAQRIEALEKEVAEHKQLEEALQESEARYRGIFEYTKNGVAVYNLYFALYETGFCSLWPQAA